LPRRKIERFIVQGREFKYWMDKNGCMNAVGCSFDRDGYPRISYTQSKRAPVAKYIYELIYGPWEKGKVMRHTCNNRACINPAHIIPGTQAENMADRKRSGKDPVGAKNGRAKITEDDVRWIRESTLSAPAIARLLGLKPGTVLDIRHRRLWKHVA
jgi:hypothetical protein